VRPKDSTPVHQNTPSKADVSALMERAAQASPMPQYLEWKLPGADQTFLLAVAYVDGINGEPTWEMGPGDAASTEVFLLSRLKNPGEVHRLMLKKMTPAVEARPPKTKICTGPWQCHRPRCPRLSKAGR